MSAREGFSPKEKGKMMLSSETCLVARGRGEEQETT